VVAGEAEEPECGGHRGHLERGPGRLESNSTTMKASTSTTPSTSVPPTHSAFPPPSTASLARSSRIAPHSHIKALGLTPEGLATTDGAGFIGQNNAREVNISFLDLLNHSLTNMTL
jgi:hypothetical protein